ncbi:MAG: nucleotidyltransferase domain-containing protein [Ferruginibacter sp.]|nr:nucleotidyltransferase domain-containing protein [Ferruginibacter sp.]
MITTEQINLLKDVIVQTMQPEKVYLFGSYAHGVPNEDSDLDILIEVEKTDLPKVERNLEVWSAMDKYKQLHFPKDIFVFTTEEMNEWKDLKNSFINNALYQSKTLYERN